ncbi:MAG: zinc ribbon domain-containing protein [Gammaproteobacteria bacterium]|nr:zinc ribbon domain-containing protein [Gammaproteobacteria bacterium]
MPTYDYRCTSCNCVFETVHSIFANRPRCPHCEGTVERLFLYAPAVHGYMARGREEAARTLAPKSTTGGHGPNCACCHPQAVAPDKYD